MAKTFLAFLRKLIGAAPNIDPQAQLAQNAQSASPATPYAQQDSVDEKAYGPTVWGDTETESDPWQHTKSECFFERPVAAAVPSVFDKDVDASFTAWMFGVETLRADRPGAAERRAIEQLMQAGHGKGDPNLVPRLPMVLPELMRLSRRDDVSPKQLAERLSSDPTMVGEVVRLANSPRYRTVRDISNLQGAVMLLGSTGLQQLVASVALRPIFNKGQGRFSRTSGTRVWDLAQRCSHASVLLSDRVSDLFHAYLAGVVSNVGLIAALRVVDTAYDDAQAPDTEDFHKAFHDASARLSCQIAKMWDFPHEVCDAVRQLQEVKMEAQPSNLRLTLRVADKASKWHMLAPGLSGMALDGLHDAERRCYVELERAFGA